MQLLVVRHAIAEDRDEFAKSGLDDSERPLTANGRKRMARGALGLRDVVPAVGLIATSPFVRARETAEILQAVSPAAETAETDSLTPTVSFEGFLDWLGHRSNHDVVTAVGHEPHLSGLAGWLLTGRSEQLIELKKGAACLIEFPGKPWPAAGQLLWALTPRQLRSLAR